MSKEIKDPFMGKIELTEVGGITKHMMGETRIDVVYTDSRG